jgi:hypothetical protein
MQEEEIVSVRVPRNSKMHRAYSRTGQDSTPDRQLRSFLAFYALQWNEDCLETVCYPIKALHKGWIESLLDFDDLERAIVANTDFLAGIVVLQGIMLKVPSIEDLLGLLCKEGLITPVAGTYTPILHRLIVRKDCEPTVPIINFFKKMLADGWALEKTVQITAADVVRVLNGGEVGTYRQTCVRQFMKSFLHNESVVGYVISVGGQIHEKYIVDVERVVLSLEK